MYTCTNVCACAHKSAFFIPWRLPKGLILIFRKRTVTGVQALRSQGCLGDTSLCRWGPFSPLPCPSGLQNLGSLPDRPGSPACSGRPQFTQLCREQMDQSLTGVVSAPAVEDSPPCYPNPGQFFLHPCGFLTKRGMLALEMFSPPAIFARGLNASVKNRNNEGRQKLLTLSHEARTGSQDPPGS